jgi:hypothetical protein
MPAPEPAPGPAPGQQRGGGGGDGSTAPPPPQQQLTFEEWVKLDSPGLIGWVNSLGLLPEEVKDAVDSFESNPDFDGSALAAMVDGEDWMMEMQFPDDFGLLREKLVNAIETLRAKGGVDSGGKAKAEQQASEPEAPPEAPPTLRPRSKQAPPYHQRTGGGCACYREQFCAVHALNNLFCNEAPRLSGSHFDSGGEAEAEAALFSAGHLNAIAQRMQRDQNPHALLNPHRWLCLGNFDAAVIDSAVKLLGYRPDVFGQPHSALDLESADLPCVAGFIVTTPSLGALAGAHRYCIREVDGYWWRLDGRKPAPVEYADTTSVFGHLQHIVDHGGTIVRVRRPAPNIFGMGVEGVVGLLRSLGLGEPLPYVKRCRDMQIDGFWLSQCGSNELQDGRPMKNPKEPGHNEFQGLMVQFPPHRELLLRRIEALKEAASAAVWIGHGGGSASDVRLQTGLSIRQQPQLPGSAVEAARAGGSGGSSSSWSEAQCVDRIRKAFPFFTVGTAYDVARDLGGDSYNADLAIAALRRNPAEARARAARSVLTRHNAREVRFPVAVGCAHAASRRLVFIGEGVRKEKAPVLPREAKDRKVTTQRIVCNGLRWGTGAPSAGAEAAGWTGAPAEARSDSRCCDYRAVLPRLACSWGGAAVAVADPLPRLYHHLRPSRADGDAAAPCWHALGRLQPAWRCCLRPDDGVGSMVHDRIRTVRTHRHHRHHRHFAH